MPYLAGGQRLEDFPAVPRNPKYCCEIEDIKDAIINKMNINRQAFAFKYECEDSLVLLFCYIHPYHTYSFEPNISNFIIGTKRQDKILVTR